MLFFPEATQRPSGLLRAIMFSYGQDVSVGMTVVSNTGLPRQQPRSIRSVVLDHGC